MSIFFKFHTDEDDKDRDITFSKESTIEELLFHFLTLTNSIMTLDQDKIVFMNKVIALNSLLR